ncbi:MAG: DUF3786 domain-containing protein [Proteobacteria bacterium]|nr:DUF3786 domain-containing protein [Pseudomonadota bacterium]MBU1716288.1 DUF3786 domain-containing protein [Pseudomonadota bacterium]
MNPLEIVSKTPKNNCGKCGYLTCLAFAAAVTKTGVSPGKCPFLDLTDLNLTIPEAHNLEDIPRQKNLQLIEYLKSKVAVIDFSAIASPLGAQDDIQNKDALIFQYLAQNVYLSKTDILIDNKIPEDPRDQILLYNYVHSRGNNNPGQEWIGLESLPNTISKVKTLAIYAEEPISRYFSNLNLEQIIKICTSLNAIEATHENNASAGMIFPVLPKVPLYLLYWEAEPNEGFASKTKILFRDNVLNYLDLETLVFTAERLAERIISLAG